MRHSSLTPVAWRCGRFYFDWQKNPAPLVMGILNVTPDSFSDGGLYNNVNKALRRAEIMLSEGAGIIDIGGESTRPGSSAISEKDNIVTGKQIGRAHV